MKTPSPGRTSNRPGSKALTKWIGSAMLVGALMPLVYGQGAPERYWTSPGARQYYYFNAALTFSPGGSLVAWPEEIRTYSTNGQMLTANQGIRVGRVGDGSEVRFVPGFPAPAFSPDGLYLASFSTNENSYVGLDIYRLADGQRLITIPAPQSLGGLVAFSPDGTKIATSSGGSYKVYLWNAQDGASLQTLDCGSSVWTFSFSPDGTTLAAAAGATILWQVSNGQRLRVLKNSSLPANQMGVMSLAFSPDGRLLAEGTFGYEGFYPSMGYLPAQLRLWRVADGQLIRRFAYTARVTDDLSSITGLGFSKDGGLLVSGSEDGSVRFWRVGDGTLLKLYDQPAGPVLDLVVSPDGRSFAWQVDTTHEVVIATMPLMTSGFARVGDQLVYSWQGGTGVYQVQTTTNLLAGSWMNFQGPTTNFGVAMPLPLANTFFRVQNVTNSP